MNNTCYYCKQYFENRIDTDNHIKKHHQYPCTKENCDIIFNSYTGLRHHISRTHKLKDTFKYYVKFYLNDIIPICKCGCGEQLTESAIMLDLLNYKRGHIARIKNNWGHNPEAMRKSHETQKRMYQSDELVVWNKGLTKEDPRVKKYADYWNKPENKQRQREKTIKRISEYYLKTSSTEYIFEELLYNLNIKYEHQYPLNEIGVFDFYLPDYNILIEVDGDWWHCNNIEPLSKPQLNNVKKDQIKNNWAKENNIKLLRFWESDINNNPASVTKKLLNELDI